MRITLPPLLLAALVAAACFPQPDDPIDYVELEETIVVQMDEVDATAYSKPSILPEFTLYGDGTLLMLEDVGDGDTIVRAHLSKGAIEDLLEFIEGTGFFNFTYEQPTQVLSSAGATYFYVNTREATNAVAAPALGAEVPDTPDYDQVRKLIEIRERLEEIAGAIETEPFEPEAGELWVSIAPPGMEAEGSWPYDDIDVATGVEPGPRVTRALSREELAALDLGDAAVARWCPVEADGVVVCVTYRPVLPFEENFPEFEGPG